AATNKGEAPMSSVQTALLGRSTAAAGARVESLGLYRVALWVLLGANLLAGWGVQWDIQWHVRVGRDSFWIPPHVMTYAGVTIVVLASFGVLARDTLRRLVAYLYGGIWFYTYPILGALLLPLALVAAARFTGRRSAPLVVVVVVIAFGMIGANIARVGFEILQPVSVIQEEIAKDPTSPIAVSNAIARKNGSAPGGALGGNLVRLVSLVPVLFLVALDPRRRPVPATLAYAVGLFAVWGVTIGRTPA